MNALPPALWSITWREADLAVFATGDDSPLAMGDAAAVLSADEQTRAARFHFMADRERWIRSRALLRLTLARRLPVPPQNLAFATGTHGKPWLPDYPGCHFNLSHSADLAAIAIGAAPLGIDIEPPRDDFSAASLAAHAFRPEEAAAIAASDEPHLLFYRMWTVKEAVMKCTGMGMSLSPDSIGVPCDADGIPCPTAWLADGTAFDILTRSQPGGFVLAAAVCHSQSGVAQLPAEGRHTLMSVTREATAA